MADIEKVIDAVDNCIHFGCGEKCPYGSCPNCLKPIDSDVNPKACGHCGQAVKWE